MIRCTTTWRNENITNVGTRYGKSNYGGSTLFKQVGVCLTDFGMDTNEMTFTLGDEGQSTAYFYNTKDASGAYTNNRAILPTIGRTKTRGTAVLLWPRGVKPMQLPAGTWTAWR